MPVFKPRNRLVNFRLSEEEFDRLRASCSLNGARSLSDFARAAVLRSVAGLQTAPDSDSSASAPDTRVSQIDQKVVELESRVTELLRLMDNLQAHSVDSPAPVSSNGATQA
jgi:hypothetical protein